MLVNGKPARLIDNILTGDELTVIFDEKEDNEYILDSDLPLDVIYEDEDILVVNKPAGIPVHPNMFHEGVTLANVVAGYYHRQGESVPFRCNTRLDTDTTGPVLLGKNIFAAQRISAMVAERKLEKEYLALVQNEFDQLSGTIDRPIWRPDPSSVIRAVCDEGGQNAVTHYHVIIQNKGYALVALKLETGRTHQIRVHMASIGHPLAGDKLYNPQDHLMARQGLHVRMMAFDHPVTGQPLHFEVAVPEDMEEALNKLFR